LNGGFEDRPGRSHHKGLRRETTVKKAILTIGVLALMASGAHALANDIPDGDDCATGESGVTPGSEPDRLAVCVSDGNGIVVFYAGGEGSAEESGDNPCGAVIVADETVVAHVLAVCEGDLRERVKKFLQKEEPKAEAPKPQPKAKSADPAPGDRLVARITRKGRLARGVVERVERAAPDRVRPDCPHYERDRCGGCQLQHLTLGAQREAKRRRVGLQVDSARRLERFHTRIAEVGVLVKFDVVDVLAVA
jgi:hypothetical protein